jgi:UDP-N-acetylmuramoyl-tripeptide--D-alanyl-D-alanine ligase
MKSFPIAALAQIIKAEVKGNTGGVVGGVSTDSRTIKKGECFFAVAGENFDGHDYIPEVFAKGAACAVVDKDVDGEKFAGRCILKVSDTVKSLGEFAAEYRRQANFKVIAITGSAGKTTTRQIIYHVLKSHFRCCQSPKSFNNSIGVPLTLLGAGPQDEIVVAELGTNHPGEIAYLTQIAQPDIALVTNVHPAHLEGFGSVEAIAQEKLSVSDGLRKDGILIINGDSDLLIGACRNRDINFLTFGKSKGCDIKVREIVPVDLGSRFTIEEMQIFLPLPGPGNIENAVAAWAVCSRFALTTDDFARAVKTFSAVSMRSELLQIGKLMVLNDCYNANPASMKNALETLSHISSSKKRRPVFICGNMAELGEQTEFFHTELGNSIAQAKVQLLLTVGNLAKIAADAAKRAAHHNLQTESFDDVSAACDNLAKFIKDDDIILVKGSRIVKLELVVEKLNQIFS